MRHWARADALAAGGECIAGSQLCRRNLSKVAHKELIGRKYDARKKRVGRPEKSGQNDHITESTAEEIAEEEGVSEKTVRRAAELADDMDTVAEVAGDDVRDALRSKDSKATEQEIGKLAEVRSGRPGDIRATRQEDGPHWEGGRGASPAQGQAGRGER